jgi:hypothetical protein
MPERIGRRLLAEIGFLAALIALPAVPLIAWRNSPLLSAGWPLAAFFVGWLAVLAVWLKTSPAVVLAGGDGPAAGARPRRFTGAAVALLLFLLTLQAFYLPLRVNFWGGVDEFANFQPEFGTVWSNNWDVLLGRPLVGLPTYVALLLRPGRVEGFLWVGVFLCFANGWLLYLLLGRLMPRAALVPVAAAVFLIVNRADPLRFYVMWAANHYGTVTFLLLLASWLFVLSYQVQSRGLLVLSCVALGGSLLSNESAYPTAALVPLFGLAVRRERERYAVWAFAWYGTVALLASRLLYYLFSNPAGSYQAEHSREAFRHPELLFANLKTLLAPALTYVKLARSWDGYLPYAVGAFALAVLAAAAVGRKRAGTVVGPVAVVAAAAAVLCGVAPFLPLSTAMRTQFLVAPAEATLLALLLGFAGRVVPVRARAAVGTLAVGLVAANATVAAAYSQDKNPSPVRFERTVHLFRQVHGLSPSFAPGTLLVFVLEDRYRSPVGFNYNLFALSKHMLGAEAIQVNFNDAYKWEAAFNADGVFAVTGWGKRQYAYEQLVAFGLGEDGTVTLLRQLPAFLLPAPGAGAAYNPLPRLRPGPFAEMPFLRYPSWAPRPGDVVSPEDGVLLGDGWGPRIPDGKDVYRYAADGAELVVNSRGASHRELTLELAPPGGQGDAPYAVEARDAAGTLVATAELSGRGEVRLTLPTTPDRACSFRLHVRPALGSRAPGRGASSFRAFRRAGARPFVPPAKDVFRDGLCATGPGWHGPEEAGGERFRWVDRDAELDVRFLQTAGSDAVLAVQTGPAYGDRPCTLEIRDTSDRLLSTRTFSGRQTLRVPVASVPDGLLRLHVRGEAKADDPRVLNYRVFDCGAAPR